jgi:endoplasmic reticulum junction formation protein lunapark
MEYTVVSGGPIMYVLMDDILVMNQLNNNSLYAVRYILTSWYNYRISNASDNLDSLYKERDSTIEKLKQATKYNSTQQLLEKYGTSRPGSGTPKDEAKERNPKSQDRRASDGRMLIQPPPTANIPRRHSAVSPTEMQNQNPGPTTPQGNGPALSPQGTPSPAQLRPPPTIDETAEFAPNAYEGPMQYMAPEMPSEPRWYDRLVNALLGEDETRPDRRLALICSKCRLVNGLAPPGARTLEEVGRWKCSSCGSWNGVEVPISNRASPSHSRNPSVAIGNVDEILRKSRSGSADSGSTEGFESIGSR